MLPPPLMAAPIFRSRERFATRFSRQIRAAPPMPRQSGSADVTTEYVLPDAAISLPPLPLSPAAHRFFRRRPPFSPVIAAISPATMSAADSVIFATASADAACLLRFARFLD
jgi:hypothetical protein